MTPQQEEIMWHARRELREHARGFQQHGMDYLTAYIAWLTEGKAKSDYPQVPTGLRSEFAKAIREVATDTALVVRR